MLVYAPRLVLMKIRYAVFRSMSPDLFFIYTTNSFRLMREKPL